jgi:hypothetical protein
MGSAFEFDEVEGDGSQLHVSDEVRLEKMLRFAQDDNGSRISPQEGALLW